MPDLIHQVSIAYPDIRIALDVKTAPEIEKSSTSRIRFRAYYGDPTGKSLPALRNNWGRCTCFGI